MAELTLDQQRAIAIARARRLREEQGGGNPAWDEYQELPWYGKAAQAADDTVRFLANGITLGYADEIAGNLPGGGSPEAQAAATQAARDRAGSAGTAAEIVGTLYPAGLLGKSALSATRLVPQGWTGMTGLTARSLATGSDAGLLGAVQAAGQGDNPLVGYATGLGMGALGNVGGEAISAGATKASRALQAFRADPQTRSALEIRGLVDDAGGAQTVERAIDGLGPDAMIVDALGERGLAVGRQSANLDPAARETLETSLLGRKAGQNARVVSDIERLSGLPVGNRKTVDILKREAYDAVKPQINAAYREARKAGAEIDFKEFDNIITTPIGRRAFQQALENVTSRAARDPNAGGNLAVLDETKRLLDGYAKQGYASQDPMASEYASAAAALRNRLDELLAGDEYAAARGLRQEAYRADEAFDLGDELGSSRVGIDVPGRVAKVDPKNRSKVAQGYAARKADTLLNRGSTEGALNELSTPMGREAAEAALGKGALKKTVDREKAFNQTVKALTGNSTTARQMLEMGLGTGAAMSMLTGDPFSGGLAGILAALARKGGPALAKKMATDSQKSAAPIIAEMLTKRNLPPEIQKLAPGVLEKFVGKNKDAIVRALVSSALVAGPGGRDDYFLEDAQGRRYAYPK